MLVNVELYTGINEEGTFCRFSHIRLSTAQEEECVLPVSVGMCRQELDIHSDSLKLHSAKVHCDKQDVTSQ